MAPGRRGRPAPPTGPVHLLRSAFVDWCTPAGTTRGPRAATTLFYPKAECPACLRAARAALPSLAEVHAQLEAEREALEALRELGG